MASSSLLLQDKFAGCLLGAIVGDVIGAPVEAESPGYLRKAFKTLDDILALKTVPELITGEWEVGRFTDDSQMLLCVAEWLVEGKLDGRTLLQRFCEAYEPGRHYGPGTRLILESFPRAADQWRSLATAMFPQGSYGNGSAMRVAPVGLFLHNDLTSIIEVARISSETTHSHYLAIQGAALQATAVTLASRGMVNDVSAFVRILGTALAQFQESGQDTSIYGKALARINEGLAKGVASAKIAALLGNSVKVHESVPAAIYCFLANTQSFEKALESAIFLGGDTDTIGCMTGAIAGASLGASAIPDRWLNRISEPVYTRERIREIAMALYRASERRNNSVRKTTAKK